MMRGELDDDAIMSPAAAPVVVRERE